MNKKRFGQSNQELTNKILKDDHDHVWHPYATFPDPTPVFPVSHARGVNFHLTDGRVLIDGMSSWWAAIHGYNHPLLNQAVKEQLHKTSHVMLGGLTHEPVTKLCSLLSSLTPGQLDAVFLSDSGSVAVEIAIKMALQFWHGQGQSQRNKLMTVRGGYHGDTFAAMSVSDPINGMHSLFSPILPSHIFLPAPQPAFGIKAGSKELGFLHDAFNRHHKELAGIIIEPIVQGAGGMRFYSADYLYELRQLCSRFKVLLIVDEIATGFGRSGKWFACEHSNIVPDIMCLGKALTGGYLSLAATLCSQELASTICHGEPGKFMHGPTFMGNPLACHVAYTNLRMLCAGHWKKQVATIENLLIQGLTSIKNAPSVADVRVLGAIGVVEMKHPIDLPSALTFFAERGVWLRPYGNLLYTMPPYIISPQQLETVTTAMCEWVKLQH